jgi:hypothetical protein
MVAGDFLAVSRRFRKRSENAQSENAETARKRPETAAKTRRNQQPSPHENTLRRAYRARQQFSGVRVGGGQQSKNRACPPSMI